MITRPVPAKSFLTTVEAVSPAREAILKQAPSMIASFKHGCDHLSRHPQRRLPPIPQGLFVRRDGCQGGEFSRPREIKY